MADLLSVLGLAANTCGALIIMAGNFIGMRGRQHLTLANVANADRVRVWRFTFGGTAALLVGFALQLWAEIR